MMFKTDENGSGFGKLFNTLSPEETQRLSSCFEEIRMERLQKTEVFQDPSNPLFSDMEQCAEFTRGLSLLDGWVEMLQELAHHKLICEQPESEDF